MSTYRILIVGIVGAKPTGGKKLFYFDFVLNIFLIRFGY
jgi:hypothetical protein